MHGLQPDPNHIASTSEARAILSLQALAPGRLARMSLEESSLERIGDRCEECGAKLTPQEIQAAMESGGPALCSIHATEDEPGLAADEAGFTEGE